MRCSRKCPGSGELTRSLFRRETGQSMVEIAVLLPIATLLLIGVMELGYGIYSYILVVRAGHEGARITTNGGDDANSTAATLSVISSLPITTSGTSKVDVYIVRAQTNGSGAISSWTASHTLTSPNATTPVSASTVQGSLTPGGASAANLKLGIVQVFYRHQPLFGFDIGPFAQGIPLSSYTIQRDVSP